MKFRDNKAIYLQIAEYVCERIILKEWASENKILSVRDLAVQLEVNPNTVMRTYDFLQNLEIIYNKRGIGLFVSADAISKANTYLKEAYISNELPVLFKNMELLNIDIKEMESLFKKHLKSKK